MKTTTIGYYRRLAGLALSLALTGSIFGSTALAQDTKKIATTPQDIGEENLFVTFSAPFYNKYYYRGLNLYPDASFQPSIGVFYDLGDFGTIGASAWMQIPLADDQRVISAFDQNGQFFQVEQANKFVELDPSINYDYTAGIATISVGHLWYTDPHEGTTSFIVGDQEVDIGPAAPDTAEVYGGVALDTILEPQLTVYHDYRRFDYQYYALSFSQYLDSEQLGGFFGEGFNITPFVLFGLVTGADKVYASADGLKHVNVGVRSTMNLGRIRVTPILQYNFGTDDEINGRDRTTDDFVFGVDFSVDLSSSI